MTITDPVRAAYRLLAFLAVVSGLLGMLVSFLFLGSSAVGDIAAGASGFLAGAVLVGSGLVASSVLIERSPPGAGAG